jgi:hypothetical protein
MHLAAFFAAAEIPRSIDTAVCGGGGGPDNAAQAREGVSWWDSCWCRLWGSCCGIRGGILVGRARVLLWTRCAKGLVAWSNPWRELRVATGGVCCCRARSPVESLWALVACLSPYLLCGAPRIDRVCCSLVLARGGITPVAAVSAAAAYAAEGSGGGGGGTGTCTAEAD